MSELFNRDIKVTAGPLTIEARTSTGVSQPLLKMKFSVEKSRASEPNKAELSIWNLTEDNRAKLQESGLEVTIEAGYVGGVSQIFKGDLENAVNTREVADWITTLELGDGTKKLSSSRINLSFRGGQSAGQMLKKVAQATGLDLGNLNEKVSSDGARSVLKEFINNVVLSGKTSDVLDEVTSALGLGYSVQDKKFQFAAPNEASTDPAVILNSGTGLIGVPQIGEKGTVTANSLLNGTMFPGRLVQLSSAVVSGTFLIEKLQHTGDTWGNEWNTKLELVQA